MAAASLPKEPITHYEIMEDANKAFRIVQIHDGVGRDKIWGIKLAGQGLTGWQFKVVEIARATSFSSYDDAEYTLNLLAEQRPAWPSMGSIFGKGRVGGITWRFMALSISRKTGCLSPYRLPEQGLRGRSAQDGSGECRVWRTASTTSTPRSRRSRNTHSRWEPAMWSSVQVGS